MGCIKRFILSLIGISAFILLISESSSMLLLLMSKVIGAVLCFIFYKLWKMWKMAEDKFVKKIE